MQIMLKQGIMCAARGNQSFPKYTPVLLFKRGRRIVDTWTAVRKASSVHLHHRPARPDVPVSPRKESGSVLALVQAFQVRIRPRGGCGYRPALCQKRLRSRQAYRMG